MRTVRLVGCLMLLVCFLAAYPAGTALAQEWKTDKEKAEEKLEMSVPYPSVESIAGGDFEFEVRFKYTGDEARDFELKATAPKGWEVHMTPKYEKEKKIKSINLKPSTSFGDAIRVVASAPFWPLPDPGEYKITLDAAADNVTASTELTAVITAKYVLKLVPTNERYNTKATAGKDNIFSIDVNNLGTAAIEKIEFKSSKPEGWTIEYSPEKIERLEAFDTKTVDVNIKPPPKTIAGDYMIGISASGQQESAKEIDIRVTVETPTIWGWVGVVIIVLVFAGLVVIFMRFSRR